MDTTNIVALLLFVLPGILAEKISHRMDFPAAEKNSDFKEMVNGILLSMPIIFVVGIASVFINKFSSLKQLINEFNDLFFLATFSIAVFLLAIIVGVLKGLSTEQWYKAINKIRGKLGKMDIDDKCCWRQVFLEKKVNRYIKIIKDEKILAQGFSKHYSLPNEEMSIVLEQPEGIDYYLENHPEFMDHLKLWETYVNIEKGVIVEVYDTSEAEKYLESLEARTTFLDW
ncbi:hypothetical protein CACET_c31630 [Clostridium aceticum]|uniref:Uncharacterized protein n=1 Tax=Clostridium aceticum TaxID=84022 RepID=A0A0D8I721_9CLOT|nr:hypothetical protein [Clostridium aceticum]AKL96607.1 hypothetical protein CACET_c31630 [Clostridium aceticum]KJF26085.1 hypothetical protein TZ02_15310 [Clostridium aceticum]